MGVQIRAQTVPQNRGTVIWVTGLSGTGKTTLCEALRLELTCRSVPVVLLDGEVLRAAMGDDLGYSETDRVRQVRRIQGLAALFSSQGIHVLVAALYAREDLLTWNRSHLTEYFEVYLTASREALELRDTKGLYKRSREGAIRDVVGVDISWNVPSTPDLVIDTTGPRNASELAREILESIAARKSDRG